MTKSILERLLRPRTIAVIGGGFFGTNVVRQCLKAGFAGEIWPVHPKRDEVEGVRAFRNIADLPEAPDAAFIGVNRFATIDIVRDLAARGAGGAVCFASGFLEAEDGKGEDLNGQLLQAAGKMPILGPNCYGLINYADGALLWPDQHGGERLAPGGRGAAIITQSSNIAINMTMQRRGLPLSYVVAAGNQAQTGLSDIALGLIEDERVSVLGLHIEGFDSVVGFERLAARARELKKPIVAMKVGRSEQARQATISHTASLAGSDAASGAFLKRLGIARVDTIPSFLETLKLLHVTGPLEGKRLSSMSCSGGEASVMADAAMGRKVGFPGLGADHAAGVGATLGGLVTIANPLDYHTFIWNDLPAMTDTFTAMVAGGFDLNLLVLDFPRADRCTDEDWWPTVKAFETALDENGARGAVVASLSENLPEDHCKTLFEAGVAPLCGINEAMDAAEAAVAIGEAWQRPSSPHVGGRGGSQSEPERGAVAEFPPLRLGCASTPLPPAGGEDRRLGSLDEAAAKALLAQAGLPVPQGRRAGTAQEAVAAARELGFPVAIKALGLAHKSERNAVRLNLNDERAVQDAAEELSQIGSGLLVERMVEGGIGELIVGVTRDPLFGPVMTIGTGGVLVELLNDSATVLLPSSRAAVEAALRGLKLFPLLDGYRGRRPGDLDAALDAIMDVADFALANAERLAELDINPLIVCGKGKGAWVADALLIGEGMQGDEICPMS